MLLIFYPGEYVLGALLFLLTLFFIKRDLKRLNPSGDQSALINPLNGDTISQLDESGLENAAFQEDSSNASEDMIKNNIK